MAKAKAVKTTTTSSAEKPVDVSSVLAQVAAAQRDASSNHLETYNVIHAILEGVSKLVPTLPKAKQPAAWEQVYPARIKKHVDALEAASLM